MWRNKKLKNYAYLNFQSDWSTLRGFPGRGILTFFRILLLKRIIIIIIIILKKIIIDGVGDEIKL